MVTLYSLLAPEGSAHLSSYCAVGYVLPALENAVDDADGMLDPDLEDCQYLRLSTICRMELFLPEKEHTVLDRYDLQMLIEVAKS